MVGIDARLRLVDSPQFERRTRVDFDFDMTFHLFRSTNLPGPDREPYWSSAYAYAPFTVNIPGVQDPVVDDLIGRISRASTREELVAATRALDRVLVWNAYVLPGWYIGSIHYAYWDRFGRADRVTDSATQRDVGWPAIEAWWEK
jgi:microcin C transport system substrate-binding protein